MECKIFCAVYKSIFIEPSIDTSMPILMEKIKVF